MEASICCEIMTPKPPRKTGRNCIISPVSMSVCQLSFNKIHIQGCLLQVNEGKVEMYDPELRRQLNLSTADLRFADNLVKIVTENQGGDLFDETGEYLTSLQ